MAAVEDKTDRHSTPLVVVCHAGAGYHSTGNGQRYKDVLRRACESAHQSLLAGGSSVGAVATATSVLESDPVDGTSGAYGSVTALSGIRNPVKVAAALLREQLHEPPLSLGRVRPMMLAGKGARAWAQNRGIQDCEPDQLITVQQQQHWQDYSSMVAHAKDVSRPQGQDQLLDTVGAVCCDQNGVVAAAVSSGGIALKTLGRVGEAAICGAGAYASDASSGRHAVAASLSGVGEAIMRHMGARQCCDALAPSSEELPADKAVGSVIESLTPPPHYKESQGIGGGIALRVDSQSGCAEVVCAHTTPSMAYAFVTGDNVTPEAFISRKEHSGITVSGHHVPFKATETGAKRQRRV